ncbi:hypothetical protein N9L54_05235 [Porticoccaceae bacterium]|nr:hypothetical protein [Porticoccaceae bacterium]
MINHFETALQDFIQEQKNRAWPFHANRDRFSAEHSSWNDLYFYHEKKDKKLVGMSICNRYLAPNSLRIRSKKSLKQLGQGLFFESYYADVAKALVVYEYYEARKKDVNFGGGMENWAQYWLGWMQEKGLKCFQYTPSQHTDFIKAMRAKELSPCSLHMIDNRIRIAISILQSKGAMDDCAVFNVEVSVSESRGVDSAKARKAKKMPHEDIIASGLSIFSEVVPKIDAIIDPHENVRNRFVACCFMLTIASTQRFTAENPFLDVHSSSLVTRKSSDGQSVHSMMYQGSKGFNVNQKHVVGELFPFVEQTLNYLTKACAPGRSLSRFYENPTRPAKDILFGFEVKDWMGIDPKKPLDLWKLGALLGLIPTDQSAWHTGHPCTWIDGYPFNLDKNQPCRSQSEAIRLLGLPLTPARALSDVYQAKTVGELQDAWINYIKRVLPNFPYRLHTNQNRVRLSDALYVFTGKQLGQSKRNSYPGGGSPFSIDSIAPQGVFGLAIGRQGSFFSDHGYSRDYALSPNQIRHYSNTMYQRSGVSQDHIALASGRKNIRQNVDYDHMTGEEIAFRSSRDTSSDEDLERSIEKNVITASQYTELTGRSATDTPAGLCTQDFTQSPCTHLSDLKYHCSSCDKAAFCKGSQRAIDAMDEDIARTEVALEKIQNLNLTHDITRRQYEVRARDLAYVKELRSLMVDPTIPNGTLIRMKSFGKDKASWDLYDIKTRKTLGRVTKALPDTEGKYTDLLASSQSNEGASPSRLQQFLVGKGLSI